MTLVSDALAIARAGIRAVDPARAVGRVVARTSRGLRVGDHLLSRAPKGELYLVAIGKAAAAMADAAAGIVGRDARGLAVTPRGYPAPTSSIPVEYGEHPVPREGSLRAGARLLRLLDSVGPDDAVLFLISGGGSAVADVPAPPLGPADLTRTTEVLLASGAPIGSMNAVRRHLSELKGGRLALRGRARSFATVALSDVVGDRPENIASGPTVGDPTRFREALRVVREYRLGRPLPRRVVEYLREGARGVHPETPKPTDPRLRAAPFVLAATNRLALEAAAAAAARRGYAPTIVSSRVTGETQPVAGAFARRVARASRGSAPRALLSGGETTVTLGPRPGRGGRNQEFAVAAAPPIADRAALILSVGTDGIDGPTDAAGGWVDGRTVRRARAGGIDLARALREHSSYSALDSLGELVRTGPTGTNVMDLHVGLVVPTPRFTLPGGLSVTAGANHWEFPLAAGRFTTAQRAWLARSGVGIPAIGRRAAPGRPTWDELLPLESQ